MLESRTTKYVSRDADYETCRAKRDRRFAAACPRWAVGLIRRSSLEPNHPGPSRAGTPLRQTRVRSVSPTFACSWYSGSRALDATRRDSEPRSSPMDVDDVGEHGAALGTATQPRARVVEGRATFKMVHAAALTARGHRSVHAATPGSRESGPRHAIGTLRIPGGPRPRRGVESLRAQLRVRGRSSA